MQTVSVRQQEMLNVPSLIRSGLHLEVVVTNSEPNMSLYWGGSPAVLISLLGIESEPCLSFFWELNPSRTYRYIRDLTPVVLTTLLGIDP